MDFSAEIFWSTKGWHYVFKVLKELWRQRQEDCHEFKANLGFLVRNKPARKTQHYPITKKHDEGRMLSLENTISSNIVDSEGQIRAGEMAQWLSTGCSSKGHNFNHHHPHGSSQPLATPVSGRFSSDLHGEASTQVGHRHACRQTPIYI